VGSPSASHRRLFRGLEASTRPPRREGLRRSLRKEEPLRGSVSYGWRRGGPGRPGGGLRLGLHASAKTAGRPGRPPTGLFHPAALDSRHRGEGDGCWRRAVRWRDVFEIALVVVSVIVRA